MAYDIKVEKETPGIRDVTVSDLPCLGKGKETGYIYQLIGFDGNGFIAHIRNINTLCGNVSVHIDYLKNYTLAPPGTSITITQT